MKLVRNSSFLDIYKEFLAINSNPTVYDFKNGDVIFWLVTPPVENSRVKGLPIAEYEDSFRVPQIE